MWIDEFSQVCVELKKMYLAAGELEQRVLGTLIGVGNTR